MTVGHQCIPLVPFKNFALTRHSMGVIDEAAIDRFVRLIANAVLPVSLLLTLTVLYFNAFSDCFW